MVKWLSHLEEAVPEQGYGIRMSMYLLSLEAWRRGINVKFFYKNDQENSSKIHYMMKYKDKKHTFYSSLGDLTTEKAFNICGNKETTKKTLKESHIPVPEGRVFNVQEDLSIIEEYAVEIGYPVVIKPLSEKAGKGVFPNIIEPKTLQQSIESIRQMGFKDFILEKKIEGEEHRVLTVGNEVIGIIKRVPAHIIGDGKKTIEELVKEKNAVRQNNPAISKKKIILDQEVEEMLKTHGYSTKSTPKEQEIIYLRTTSNISRGGDPIDVTEEVDREVMELARNVVKAIPGLAVAGIDMIINSVTKEKVIIEVNTRPMISIHMFPISGKARDAAKSIIDYYFPETRQIKRSKLFFDFDSILMNLEKNNFSEIILNAPQNLDVYTKRFILQGDEIFSHRKDVRKLLREHCEYGTIKVHDKRSIEILLGSHDEESLINTYELLLSYLESKKVKVALEELDNDTNIKYGFEYIRADKLSISDKLNKEKRKTKELKTTIKVQTNKLNELQDEVEDFRYSNVILKEELMYARKILDSLEDKNKDLEKVNEELLSTIDDMRTSRSWKLTQPLRNMRNKMNK